MVAHFMMPALRKLVISIALISPMGHDHAVRACRRFSNGFE